MKRQLKFNGSWYPSQKTELENLVKIVPKENNNDIFGVVPHAGLMYSKDLIKSFFNTLSPRISKILLITPSHYFALDDDVVGSGIIDSYECIIKDIPGYNILSLDRGYERVTQAEHAVEMILPFIAQRENISLCCAHVNHFTSFKIVSETAKKILSYIDDTTSVIASSDFTHYGDNFRYTPFGKSLNESIMNKVSLYDKTIANLIACNKAESAYNQVEKNQSTICGIAPMLLVSEMARLKGLSGRVLNQSNSIRDLRYDNNFVDYLSIAWRKNDR